MDRVWRSGIGKAGGTGRGVDRPQEAREKKWGAGRRGEEGRKKKEVWRRARQIRRNWKKGRRELAEEN